MTILPDNDPTLGLFSVLRDDGSSDPQADPFLDDATLLGMYREMLRIRILDERMLARQRQGRIGFYGSVTGQEATPVAAGFATQPADWIFPALRENAIMLVRGFPLEKWLAQVYGNGADVLKGRQMPSHMSGRAVNQVSWGSCLGPQLPQAVGAAWAAKLRKDPVVTLGFIGDGATSEPDFHSAMTFAGVYRVPCVLICQNNHWAISVPSSRQTASQTFAVKARAYGVRGVRVDGNDVLALYRTIKDAVERARATCEPTFIEAVTYRIGAHSSSDDPTRYRLESEVELWRQRDPLVRFERYLRRAELLDDAAKSAMSAAIEEQIAAAVRAVEPLAPPALGTMMDDVYATPPWHLREQLAEAQAHPAPPSAHAGGH
jgi:pyruvate dehydrogenase E1 component alpha subunit/2-oxoisovalerate dehydrogenase E1 component alpha subunit